MLNRYARRQSMYTQWSPLSNSIYKKLHDFCNKRTSNYLCIISMINPKRQAKSTGKLVWQLVLDYLVIKTS